MLQRALIKRINSELVRMHSAENRDRGDKNVYARFVNVTGNVMAE